MLLGLLLSMFNCLEQQQIKKKKKQPLRLWIISSKLQSGIKVVTLKQMCQNHFYCTVNVFSDAEVKHVSDTDFLCQTVFAYDMHVVFDEACGWTVCGCLDQPHFLNWLKRKAETSAVLLTTLWLSLCTLVSSFTSTSPVRLNPLSITDRV